jgi:hypothetical protein
MCPTFSDCARPVPKKLFVEQINFGDLPPPAPKKFAANQTTDHVNAQVNDDHCEQPKGPELGRK